MNVPKLRFKGFSDYKTLTLGDVAPLQRGFDLPISNIVDGAYPVVFSNGALKKHNEAKVSGPGVITGRSGTIGNVHFINQDFWPHNTSLWVTNFHGNSPKFIFYLYTNFDLARFGTGSGVPTLNRNDVHKQFVTIPSDIDEQEKIATFLTAVDQKISLLNKRQELLMQCKKGVMQKIFSQEIRFKDINGKSFPELKRVFLGDIAQFYKGKGISKSDISSDGLTPCIRYGELYTQYGVTINEVISKTNAPIKDLILSKANDVIIPASGETQIDIATASCVIHGGIALGGDLNIIRTEQSGVFLCYYLNSEKKLDIAKLAQGNSVVHLYASQLKGLEIELPALAEQELIAKFLSLIDKKIALCNAELIATKQYKQGLLQQMFI